MARTSAPHDDDDEALRWAGDEVRGGVDPLTRNRVVPSPASSVDDGMDVALAAPTNLPRAAATVGFAVLYLAIVVGWILSVQITGSTAADLFSQVAWQFGEFVAIISGALWYLAVLTLTPDRRTGMRVGWFALGVGVLLPWPILLVLGS
ncbi:MAG TPA: hypothetical protein VFQ74_08030 [Pseudolysinimonas sp.]|nr:hypothetical protein [Pseudolysinimonas sp.]